MNGRIYIASAFTNIDVKNPKDNDPHFWSSPPTWGICRREFIYNINIGDYVFYVFPKHQNYHKWFSLI